MQSSDLDSNFSSIIHDDNDDDDDDGNDDDDDDDDEINQNYLNPNVESGFSQLNPDFHNKIHIFTIKSRFSHQNLDFHNTIQIFTINPDFQGALFVKRYEMVSRAQKVGFDAFVHLYS